MPIQIVKELSPTLAVDVIVNAANRNLRQGTGLSDALFKAAGIAEMRAACERLGSCAPGHAVITPGFKLPAQYVIHAVGPIWVNGHQHESELLTSCYREALSLAAARKARSIAFPLISAGTYGFPRDKAFHIAQREITAFLEKHDMIVYLAVFDPRATRSEPAAWMALTAFLAHPEPLKTPECAESELPSLDDMLSTSLFDQKDAFSSAPAPETPPFIEQVMTRARTLNLDERTLCRRANMTLPRFSALRQRPESMPDRNAAMALCIALGLSPEDTHALLSDAGLFLLSSDRRDNLIRFFIQKGADINAVNAALYALGEEQLFFI